MDEYDAIAALCERAVTEAVDAGTVHAADADSVYLDLIVALCVKANDDIKGLVDGARHVCSEGEFNMVMDAVNRHVTGEYSQDWRPNA